MKWIQNLIPNENQWQSFRESLMTLKNNVNDKIEIGKHDKYIIIYICENVRQSNARIVIHDETLSNINRSTYKGVWTN